MANVIRRLELDRRAVLRGAGVSLALPILSAMAPALSRRSAEAGPVRTCFIYRPNGAWMPDWTPKGAGASFEFGPTLAPLTAFKKDVLVLTHLGINAGRALGDGAGDHARSASTYLTCVHPKKTGGKDIRAGVSVDQLIANHVGRKTRFPSLELGMERGRNGGSCDSGYACAYSNNVSWRNERTPVAKETRPREVFRRLFGDPDAVASARMRRERALDRRSILDLARGDADRLKRRLGAEDREKLAQYLDAVREVERRLQRDAAESAAVGAPSEILERSSRGFEGRLRLMYDMIVLAYQADLVRTCTFMLGNAGSNRSYRMVGVSDGHHTISHHGRKPGRRDALKKIDRWHSQQFAYFLERLRSVEEGSDDLLGRSMLLFSSGLGDPDRHDHLHLPVVVAGRMGGKIKTGRHLVFDERTPMANLYVSIMQKVGLRSSSFADSTGPLPV